MVKSIEIQEKYYKAGLNSENVEFESNEISDLVQKVLTKSNLKNETNYTIADLKLKSYFHGINEKIYKDIGFRIKLDDLSKLSLVDKDYRDGFLDSLTTMNILDKNPDEANRFILYKTGWDAGKKVMSEILKYKYNDCSDSSYDVSETKSLN